MSEPDWLDQFEDFLAEAELTRLHDGQGGLLRGFCETWRRRCYVLRALIGNALKGRAGGGQEGAVRGTAFTREPTEPLSHGFYAETRSHRAFPEAGDIDGTDLCGAEGIVTR